MGASDDSRSYDFFHIDESGYPISNSKRFALTLDIGALKTPFNSNATVKKINERFITWTRTIVIQSPVVSRVGNHCKRVRESKFDACSHREVIRSIVSIADIAVIQSKENGRIERQLFSEFRLPIKR